MHRLWGLAMLAVHLLIKKYFTSVTSGSVPYPFWTALNQVGTAARMEKKMSAQRKTK